MGKNRYNQCKEIIEDNFKKGDEVGTTKLAALIIKNIGADERTIEACLKTMVDMRLIKDINNCHWKIL